MKLKNFKQEFKNIRNAAFDLFEHTKDRVDFIFDHLNHGFKKTYKSQVLNSAQKEYEWLCSDIQHVWDNLNIR